MGYKCSSRFGFFILSGRIHYSTMIPAVVLALLLVTPTLSIPVTTQEFIAAGAQGPQTILANKGIISPQPVTGEKTQVEGATHGVTGVNEGSVVETSPTKTGAEEIPTGVIQTPGTAGHEGHSASGHTVETPITRGQSSTPTQYSGSETTSQGERTGTQVPSGSHENSETYPQSTALGKGETVGANIEQTQVHQPDNPVLLPLQPLTVVPVTQAGEFLEPVVVPAEAVTSGRVILMAIKPIQQRNFQDVITPPEKHFPYQQVIQGLQQTQTTNFGQPVENEEIQRGGQTQTAVQQQPNQVPFVKEQVVPNTEFAQTVPNQEPVSVAEPKPQTYSVQPVQPVVNEYVNKQIAQQSTDYTPVQPQFAGSALPEQQVYNVQQLTEKQGEAQQFVYDKNPHQVQVLHQQQANPTTVDSVQSQQPYQVDQPVQNKISHPSHQQQSAEGQTPYQQNTDYVPVQSQPLVQQVYNVQPDSQQNYSPVESQAVQQKVSGGQHGTPESYIPMQSHTAEHTQTPYQSGEKQVPSLQPVQSVQHDSQEPVHQQQVSSVQSFAAVPSASHVPVEPVQTENTDYVPQQLHKTSEEQTDPVVGAQLPQVVNYAEPIYNFGDKIPQNPTVQENNPFTSCRQ